jgi:hypothetical protein
MRNDPAYFAPEYACHENNTIVPNYVATNRYEREHPTPLPEEPVVVPRNVADALAGRWVGRPRIATLDLDIELTFVKNANGAIVGKLIGTTLGEIDLPLRRVRIDGNALKFELPNWQPWSFAGELAADRTIAGVLSSEQGGVPVVFEHVAPTR